MSEFKFYAQPEKLAAKFQLRLWWRLFVAAWIPRCGGGLLLYGGGILLAKYLKPAQLAAVQLWAGLALFLLITLWAVWLAVKQVPSRKKLLIYLDSVNLNGGGWLAGWGEFDFSLWAKQIKLPDLPDVRWKNQYFWLPFWVGSIFAMGAWLTPTPPEKTVEPLRRLDITAEQLDLTEKIDLLEAEQIIPGETAAELRNDLQKLAEENRAEEAAKVYDLLAAMDEKLQNAAAEAAKDIQNNLSNLSAAAQLTDLAAELPLQSLTPQISKELMEMLRKEAENNPELAKTLAEIQKNCNNSANKCMSKKDLASMSRALKSCSAAQMDKLSKLMAGKLAAQACKNAKQCGGSSDNPANERLLVEYLRRNFGTVSLLNTLNNAPGSGGVNRGRADADLAYNGNTQMTDVDNPLGLEANLARESQTIMQVSSAPNNAEDEQKNAVGGGLQATGGGRESRSAVINPEHRQTVEWYLNQDK